MKPTIILRDNARGGWLCFEAPERIVCARRLAEVVPALREAESAVEKHGLHAAGFISYEAAPAMDPALRTRSAGAFPLVWFGLFRAPAFMRTLDAPAAVHPPRGAWAPSVSRTQYGDAIRRIRAYIHSGDTYQVNYSYRLGQALAGTPWELFTRMTASCPPPYAAFVETRSWAICSASPELFFALDGTRILSRPMKGTAPRGLRLADDRAQAGALRRSAKNRAENVMIVDMVRNDLGRIAMPGTVHAERLFDVEKYPTVWQMTSTVSARTQAPLCAILRALFPAASITGAPKARTMEIIREMENTPRRIYCGAIGYIAPKRKALFSVAIRTVLVRKRDRKAEYGVGGGVVWDSSAASEFTECRTKSLVLSEKRPDFSLLETMLWTPRDGFVMLGRHLGRMADSARYFEIPWRAATIRRKLAHAAAAFAPAPHRVRLLLRPDGEPAIEAVPVETAASCAPLRVCLARKPVDRNSVFLYHKTTHRREYETALASAKGFDEVLLWNREGEVTEFATGNVVARMGGTLLTPPIRCGLLAGVYRQSLLDRGLVKESAISVSDLEHCQALFHINSVRGMRPARMARSAPAQHPIGCSRRRRIP